MLLNAIPVGKRSPSVLRTARPHSTPASKNASANTPRRMPAPPTEGLAGPQPGSFPNCSRCRRWGTR
eukprot:3104630-Lingulodinium_polyedra.AAC.1